MINYKNSRSASLQESFVISMTKEKKDGFYVELGSGDPYKENNSSQNNLYAEQGKSKGAQRSMKAAAELYAAMQGSLPDPAPAGLEPLALGVGLESGPAMAGSFGLASRRTHMVMGRTVTIASRLVDMTVDLAHPCKVQPSETK